MFREQQWPIHSVRSPVPICDSENHEPEDLNIIL